jgi:hypothetical protein
MRRGRKIALNNVAKSLGLILASYVALLLVMAAVSLIVRAIRGI